MGFSRGGGATGRAVVISGTTHPHPPPALQEITSVDFHRRSLPPLAEYLSLEVVAIFKRS